MMLIHYEFAARVKCDRCAVTLWSKYQSIKYSYNGLGEAIEES